MKLSKKRLLVLADWYLPGYKAGGPIRSVANLVGQLQNDVSIQLLTSDRDLGEPTTYPGIEIDEWSSLENIEVAYLSPSNRRSFIAGVLDDGQYDHVYLNSLFSLEFTILPLLRLKRLNRLNQMILAPRGMLGQGALGIKSRKKRLFLGLFKLFGLHRSIRWHATDASEAVDIRRVFGNRVHIEVIPNLFEAVAEDVHEVGADAPLIFISRISVKKNLSFLLSCLAKLETCAIDVIGEADDENYLSECKSLADQINGAVRFHGARPHHEISNYLKHSSFFVLPTRNENFGHAIIEALAAGCPVIISDQTPWNDLEEYGAGWVLPLNDQQAWIDCINECKNMDDETYRIHSERARSYVSSKFDQAALREQYIKLFTGED